MLNKQMRADLEGVAPRNARTVVTSSATVTTYQMKVSDLIVHVVCVGANAMAITLPSVAEACGNIYTIKFVTDGGAAVTVADKDNDAGYSTVTMSDATDFQVLYSDGCYWYLLAGQSD